MAPAHAGEAPASPPPLDPAALLAEAARANPRILAAGARLDAASRVPSQREAYPDPMASVAYTNDGLDRITLGDSVMSNLRLEWTQEVPYPGKRRLAASVAEAQAEVTRLDLETLRLEVAASVKEAYADLVRIDRTRTILDESATLLRSFLDTARRRYESGSGILENVLKAQTQMTLLDVERTALDEDRARVASRLAALLGRRSADPLGPATVPLVASPPDTEALVAAAAERAPRLLALRAAERREGVRVDRAKRDLKPDFVWSAAYMNRGGIDPLVMGGFGVRLPLYRGRKQEQAVAEAESDLAAARQDTEAATDDIVAQVRALAAAADGARHQALLYTEGVLPQSQSALDSAAAAYASGRTEFVTVIADFLGLLDAQKTLEVQRAAEARALAALEPLTGATLVAATEGERHD